jgi:predicted transcriptional regulator
MRTTIEIRDDLRGALLELAAKRGEKGFSRLVCEAIEEYVAAETRRDELRRKALRTRGALDGEEVEELQKRVREFREEWR